MIKFVENTQNQWYKYRKIIGLKYMMTYVEHITSVVKLDLKR